MSFANLKTNRANDIASLVSAAESVGGGEKKSYADERFWKPTVDKAGNGYAVLRFLPAPAGEDLPWVRYWDHGFKGPTGMWYIENSLTSIGQPDPVGEINSVLWNTGRDEDKATARDRKRRLHYVTNIMVVSDPSNPNNEGKVFLYKFGKKIFDKIMDVMQPQFQDEKPVNPFDFLKARISNSRFVKLKAIVTMISRSLHHPPVYTKVMMKSWRQYITAFTVYRISLIRKTISPMLNLVQN